MKIVTGHARNVADRKGKVVGITIIWVVLMIRRLYMCEHLEQWQGTSRACEHGHGTFFWVEACQPRCIIFVRPVYS
jgi:hypothetical protein